MHKSTFILKLIPFLRDKHALWYKGFLFIISIVIITFLLPRENHFKYELDQEIGTPWNFENLIAPFDFPIYKNESEFKNEQDKVKQDAKLFFINDESVFRHKISEFQKLNELSKNELEIGLAILNQIAEKGILENHESINGKDKNFTIYVLKNDFAEERSLDDFFTLKKADDYITNEVKNSNVINKKELMNKLLNFLSITVFYDEITTGKNLQQELSDVLPTKNKIVKGQTIINRGEIITKEKSELLYSFKKELLNSSINKTDDVLLITGQFLASFLCMSMIFLFLAFFRKNIFAQNSHVSFIVLITLLFVFISNRVFLIENVGLFLIPFAIGPIVIRAFFDTRTALFTHLNIILLTTFFANDKFEFFFIQTLAGIAAIFSIANMVRRSQLIFTAFIVFIVYVFSFTSLKLILEINLFTLSIADYYVYAASSLMVLITYPLIFVFEKVFGFVSDFTLLELSDSNSPLLRELASKAPGTFQHTLQVANLAEEAIQKVGGNPLLIRTGAMYHDIGKMENPRYFTENQVGGINPHDEFSSEESAKIITSHVLQGIELARKYNLPEQIIDFIRTHHGTTLTRFFYKRSLQEIGELTDKNKFRYPGPIPFSKETAVLMMADSIEASSRSLKTYDAISIDELVERIINSQVEEQQFNNSDITFRDVNNIKKIFKKRLMNIYHVRIEYPR